MNLFQVIALIVVILALGLCLLQYLFRRYGEECEECRSRDTEERNHRQGDQVALDDDSESDVDLDSFQFGNDGPDVSDSALGHRQE